MAIQHATQHLYPSPGDGTVAVMVASHNLQQQQPPPPPPLPLQTGPSNGQSPGYTVQLLPHPNSNSENNSPITSQASSYIPNSNGSIMDDTMVPAAVTQYDTIQGYTSTTSSSSRQVSPRVVSKPVAARYNTTGMSNMISMTTTTSTTTATTTNGIATTSSHSNHSNSNNSSTFQSTAPSSQQQPQQRLSQPPPPHQPPGFGKMLYFLDQMKLEVTDADQSIKNLQTEMKCLVGLQKRMTQNDYFYWYIFESILNPVFNCSSISYINYI